MKRAPKLATDLKLSLISLETLFREIQFLVNSVKRSRFSFIPCISFLLQSGYAFLKHILFLLFLRHMKRIHKFGCLKSARSWPPRTSFFRVRLSCRKSALCSFRYRMRRSSYIEFLLYFLSGNKNKISIFFTKINFSPEGLIVMSTLFPHPAGSPFS